MKLKKIGLLILLSMALLSTAFAAQRRPVRRGSLHAEGEMLLTPEIVFVYHTTCLGANFEYFLKKNITVGGDALLWLEGSSGMIISPDVAFHFNVKVENLDLFAGAGPALAFGFGGDGGSEFGFKPFGGARYYFSPKIAAYSKLLAFISSDSSFGAAFGVTFRI